MSSPSGSPARPLAGVRVVDFSSLLAGPMCTRWLADLGAEVIKVESPKGDPNRYREPIREGRSGMFGMANAGKRSIVLDLKQAAGRAAAVELTRRADVVVENWRPGVAGRLGIGYEQVSAINPRVVYCSISGFGQTGPHAGRAAYASVVEAASGLMMAQMRVDDTDGPGRSGIYYGDLVTAIWGLVGVQSGLLSSSKTGRGQYVDVTMLESVLSLLPFEVLEAEVGPFIRRQHEPLKTKDGFIVVPPTGDANMQAIAQAAGHPEWLTDPRFSTDRGRTDNWAAVNRAIGSWAEQHTTAECERALERTGAPYARYADAKDVMADPHFQRRGTFATVTDGSRDYKVASLPFVMSDAVNRPHGSVPALGEHTEQVLRDELGYSPEQIRAVGVAPSA